MIDTCNLDREVWAKAVEFIKQHQMIQATIEQLRCQNTQTVDVERVAQLLKDVKKRYLRLFDLAEATEDEDIYSELKKRLSAIEKEKRELERLLKEAAFEEEQAEEIEKEIARFEEWTDQVHPYLDMSTYIPTFEEKRVAILILGIRVRLFPANMGKRFEIDIAPPNVMKLLKDMRIVHSAS